MRPIPPKLKKQIAADPFMRKCVWTGSENVSWEHCWTYARKQINEAWAIVPLRGDLNTNDMKSEIKEYARYISLLRATPEDLAKYPRMNWKQEFEYLHSKFKDFTPPKDEVSCEITYELTYEDFSQEEAQDSLIEQPVYFEPSIVPF